MSVVRSLLEEQSPVRDEVLTFLKKVGENAN
jgi:hypothetical protein